MDYCDIEWFALEMNRDNSVVFEIAPMYCISDSFVDYEGYIVYYVDYIVDYIGYIVDYEGSISFKVFLPTLVDIIII